MTNKIKKNKAMLFVLPAIAVSLSLVSLTNVQTDHKTKTTLPSEKIVQDNIKDSVDVHPEFIGGNVALFKFIGENVVYPKKSKDKGIVGTVFTQFTVSKDGAIKNVIILKGVNEELDNESVRVIKLMPNWKPGELNNKMVNCNYILPIKYNL